MTTVLNGCLRHNCRVRLGVALLSLALLPPGAAGPAAQTASSRVVAIGDIHGAYDAFTAILRHTTLLDDRLRWAGGRTVLVQTGDYTDRGSDVRQVMDLLRRLEREAKSAGGRAIVLAGNHEVMNMMGDLRDVTPEIYATFATPQSERRREDAWRQYERLARSRAEARASGSPPLPAVYSQTREAWMAAHPPGSLEYIEAMGPDGTYGRWLRGKDIAAVVDRTLFMHAGLNAERPAPKSIAEVNDRARAEVRRFDALRKRLVDRRLALPYFGLQEVIDVAVSEIAAANAAIEAAKTDGTEPPALDLPLLREVQDVLLEINTWTIIDPEGPLWYRGYAIAPEETAAEQVSGFLDQLELARIVVGHTPTPDRRIDMRFGGRVLVIDTGMLAPYYKGRPSALEIRGPRLKALYPDGDTELPAIGPERAVILLKARGASALLAN